MADPLSIATGVAGIISLGLNLCNGLHTFFSAIKDKSKDVETVTQDLTLLQSNIDIIKSSTSKLANHNALAAHGVSLGLKNCERQLDALKTFMQELTSVDGLSGMKQQWRKQKMIARYPFDRRKLAQLHEQLSKANQTLSTFIQTFNLEINLGISDNLQIMDKDMRANDASVLELMNRLLTRLDMNSPTVQRTDLANATLPFQVHNQTLATKIGLSLSYEAISKATETKLASISGQRPWNKPCEGDLQPRYLRETDAEARLCNNLTIAECMCMDPTSRPVRRGSSRIYQFWGGWAISRQGSLQSRHRPGCIFFDKSPKRSWKTTLTYSGLRFMISQTLTISLTQEYPAGAYSISFGLQACNVVESSPAFDLLNWDISGKRLQKNIDTLGPVRTAERLIQDLRIIYSSGNASPFDVDEYGNNIAHKCLENYVALIPFIQSFESFDEGSDAMCKVLSYMFDIGVPVTASNFNEHTVLNCSTKSWTGLWMLPKLYNLATARDPTFCSTELAHARSYHSFVFPLEARWIDSLDVWCKYPEISEAFGFQDIFLAVMQKDLPKLKIILQNRKPPVGILDEDLYRRNILHVSSNWASGLRLLLEYEVVYPLLNARSAFFLSPLDHALLHSKKYCNTPNQSTLCHNCSCFAAVKLLLEADCSVTVSRTRPRTLKACSLRARILFFEHLRNRRTRLRQISLDHLPAEILNRYGITTQSLPDATATILWNELQKREDDLTRIGVVLSDSLKPHDDQYHRFPESFFSYPHFAETVELALRYGFLPFDECGIQPFLSLLRISGHSLEDNVAYASWLLQHNLKHDFLIGPFQLSAVHRFGSILGRYIRRFYLDNQVLPTTLLHEFNNLLLVICCSRNESNMPCPCITGMLNRPLAYLLSGLMYDSCLDDTWNNLQRIGKDIRLITLLIDLIEDSSYGLESVYLAKSTFRVLTMTFLGVRHLPICLAKNLHLESIPEGPECQKEWAEMLDEDRLLINRLNDLDEEFEDEFRRQNISITSFLQGHWLERMVEVRRELNRAIPDDYKSNLREAGVVLDEDEDDDLDLHEFMYEL